MIKKQELQQSFAILPMVLTSTFFYYKNNYINWNNGIKIAIGGTIGGFIEQSY